MTATTHAAPGEKTPSQRRVDAFAFDVIGRINQAIVDHDMTYDEYDAVKQWLIRVGEAGEWPLVLDVWFEHTVEELAARSRHGSQGTILGPYYLPDAPELPAQTALPMRSDEPGDRLVLRGQVRSLDGTPLPGATLDMWQAGADGYYSGFHPSTPEGNLRGRVRTGEEGRFEVQTVVPGPYTIPIEGPCGELCRAAGWSPWRPGHLHLIVSAQGHVPLTTQLYFEGEEYLDNDVASAVKPELVLSPAEEPGGSDRRRFSESYDFVLEPARS
ncbi:MAG: catechol 1,2-dioxygenase [Streptosporangiales bacterium]|nr:catechol 1,2-dioxygenase [Streptosporangiales bacterium]